ncbi:MAG: RraA family protein, partial [Clostridiales bacterium]|nr:RraA family protein [Clostridiales bacterium]
MKFNCKEEIIQLTPLWKGERLPDGRPKVSDDILERMRKITIEAAWATLWQKGYKYQYEGDFKVVNPDMVLVGRAVTAVMVPSR